MTTRMTDTPETYTIDNPPPIEERATYKLFNRFHSDEEIRAYMRRTYGVADIEIQFTGGGKLAGPLEAVEVP